MNNVEESFFKGELNPDLNHLLMNNVEYFPLLLDEKVIFVLGSPDEDASFHYIENKKTGKKYIMCFSALEDLNAWKEKTGIEKPHITVGKLELIYSLSSMDEIRSLGGIALDPCTLNKIIDISTFLENVERKEGTILRSPKNAPTVWLEKMKNFFRHEKSISKAYLQVESTVLGDQYLIIIDVEDKKRDKVLRKLAVLSHKYANLPVVYASLKANPTLENSLEPFYKK